MQNNWPKRISSTTQKLIRMRCLQGRIGNRRWGQNRRLSSLCAQLCYLKIDRRRPSRMCLASDGNGDENIDCVAIWSLIFFWVTNIQRKHVLNIPHLERINRFCPCDCHRLRKSMASCHFAIEFSMAFGWPLEIGVRLEASWLTRPWRREEIQHTSSRMDHSKCRGVFGSTSTTSKIRKIHSSSHCLLAPI